MDIFLSQFEIGMGLTLNKMRELIRKLYETARLQFTECIYIYMMYDDDDMQIVLYPLVQY